MGDKSKIEWTDATWNPVKGCDRVSPGCLHCYAVNDSHRMASNPNAKIAAANAGLVHRLDNGKLDWTGKINLLEDRLDQPLRWKRGRKIFVNSQSDLFHKNVPDEFIDKVFAVMAACPQHTFQILTKRADRMKDYFLERKTWETREESIYAIFDGLRRSLNINWPGWPLPNVWLGVSTENQPTFEERGILLRETPAAVRFLSVEPLVGPIEDYPFYCCKACGYPLGFYPDDEDVEMTPLEKAREKARARAFSDHGCPGCKARHGHWAESTIIEEMDWIIVGGESGSQARPMHPGWVQELRDRCVDIETPFFFKQWGAYSPEMIPGNENGVLLSYAGKKCGHRSSGVTVANTTDLDVDPIWMYHAPKADTGRTLDGQIWEQWPGHYDSDEGG